MKCNRFWKIKYLSAIPLQIKISYKKRSFFSVYYLENCNLNWFHMATKSSSISHNSKDLVLTQKSSGHYYCCQIHKKMCNFGEPQCCLNFCQLKRSVEFFPSKNAVLYSTKIALFFHLLACCENAIYEWWGSCMTEDRRFCGLKFTVISCLGYALFGAFIKKIPKKLFEILYLSRL